MTFSADGLRVYRRRGRDRADFRRDQRNGIISRLARDLSIGGIERGRRKVIPAARTKWQVFDAASETGSCRSTFGTGRLGGAQSGGRWLPASVDRGCLRLTNGKITLTHGGSVLGRLGWAPRCCMRPTPRVRHRQLKSVLFKEQSRRRSALTEGGHQRQRRIAFDASAKEASSSARRES